MGRASFFAVALINPRMLWFCHPVASAICASVAPSPRRNRPSTVAFLDSRASRCGWFAFDNVVAEDVAFLSFPDGLREPVAFVTFFFEAFCIFTVSTFLRSFGLRRHVG